MARNAAIPLPGERAALSMKQRAFVAELVKDREFNAPEAAVRAGYARGSCKTQSAEMLKLPAVQMAIGQALQERTERTKVDADRVVQELARIALMNPQDLLDEHGRFLPLAKLTAAAAACVRKFKVVPGRVVRDSEGNELEREPDTYEYELWDKMDALSMLAKHVGILKDSGITVTTTVNINFDELARPRKMLETEGPDPVEAMIKRLTSGEVTVEDKPNESEAAHDAP